MAVRELNETMDLLECEAVNGCLDEETEEKATTCRDAIMCFDFTIWQNNQQCSKKGCFTMDSQVLFYCNKVNLKVVNNLTSGYEGYCCNEQSFCNRSPVSPEPVVNLVTVVAISASIILFCLLIPLILYIVLRRRRTVNDRKHRRRNMQKDRRNEENSTLDSAKYITSGSGAGFPLLIERTLTKEIQLETQISKGKFGEVWKANYQNRKVAVKKFQTTDYESWKKEREIYDHYSLANDYILKYLGSDITSSESCTTEFWIVLDYHELGSLYDYLQRNSLSRDQVLSIMHSAICGLVHLHDLFEFTNSKPAIAHRDIKSKNLLMKTERTVCIADFGLSVTSKGIETNKYEHLIIRSGTKRYMPPEVLAESIDEKRFKSFQMADIYSFSLLLWEIVMHSELNPELSSTYRPPYYEWVGEDPSFDVMKKVVSIEKKRPSLAPFLGRSKAPAICQASGADERGNESVNEAGNSRNESGNETGNEASNELRNEAKDQENSQANESNDQQLIAEICELIENCWLEDASKRFDYIEIRKRFSKIINRDRVGSEILRS